MKTILDKFVTQQKQTSAANPAKDGGALNLHGWTLAELESHCAPDEWEEIKDQPEVITCIARNLREFPFLFQGDVGGG